MLYDIKPDERLFSVTKSYLNHEMERGTKQTGVKKIRVHDIRHSAVSLLINMGFSVLAIGERMGHEAPGAPPHHGGGDAHVPGGVQVPPSGERRRPSAAEHHR